MGFIPASCKVHNSLFLLLDRGSQPGVMHHMPTAPLMLIQGLGSYIDSCHAVVYRPPLAVTNNVKKEPPATTATTCAAVCEASKSETNGKLCHLVFTVLWLYLAMRLMTYDLWLELLATDFDYMVAACQGSRHAATDGS